MNDIATNCTATNHIAKQNPHPRGRTPDPREVLDPKKRTKICGLLALGYSIRMTAEHIGCDPSTITRTAKRDERFRDQLAAAQSDADIDALKLLRRTADQERYWRAAAWILERRNPDEYGRRSPNSFSGEQVIQILGRVLQTIMPAVPAEQVEEVMYEFEEELADVAEKARLPLPDYYLPEEEEEAGVEISAKPQAIGESDCSALTSSQPLQTPSDAAATPAAERETPASVPALNDRGKRVSCLQQFVQRVPKAAPPTSRGNAPPSTANATRCATLSAGNGRPAAAAAKS